MDYRLYTVYCYIIYIIYIRIINNMNKASIVISKIFRRKDITLTRNCVIRICIQNTLVPPIAGYF